MFHINDDWSYRMPVHFCGSPGAGVAGQRYDDVTNLTISYRTDAERLARYVPDAFDLLDPVLTIIHQACRGVRWMAGGGYNLINVSVPARHRTSGVTGAYILVIWEEQDGSDPRGREETGMPKVFAEINEAVTCEQHVFAHASHEGRAFLELHAELMAELSADEVKRLDGRLDQLGWRYIPNVGRPGAALSHATLYPVDVSHRSATKGSGTVTWTKAEPAFNPMQWMIVNALSDLPILEY